MLLLLIALAWLAVVTVLVAACRAAARAERPSAAASEEQPELVREGLAVWDPVAARALRAHYAARGQRVHARGREETGVHTRAQRTHAHGLGRAR
jgi:hypothetical protein